MKIHLLLDSTSASENSVYIPIEETWDALVVWLLKAKNDVMREKMVERQILYH